MPKNPKIKNISNLGIYKKLDSLEKKIDKQKSKSQSFFVANFITSMGLAIFIVGLTFFIQLITGLGAELWIISISYICIGVFFLIIGLETNLRIR